MIILTIDTDWAPEAATKFVLEKVRALGIKTTVFFSTPSPVSLWPEVEAGCHPDLSKRLGSNGNVVLDDSFSAVTPDEMQAASDSERRILGTYRKAFPAARVIRTHRFYWHSDLPRALTSLNFQHDSSLILPYHPGLKGFKVGQLTRWPVWASDHLHLARRFKCDKIHLPNWDEPGLKIFCFHVAYLYLNASSLNNFNMINDGWPQNKKPSHSAEAGVWDFFELLAEQIYKRSQNFWLSEIPDEYIVAAKTLT